MRSLKDNNRGYTILISGIIFAGLMLGLSWFVEGMEAEDPNVYVETHAKTDPEADFWNDTIGWVGDRIEENSVLQVLTLDCVLINSLGFIGMFIKIVWGVLITIGITELIWIG